MFNSILIWLPSFSLVCFPGIEAIILSKKNIIDSSCQQSEVFNTLILVPYGQNNCFLPNKYSVIPDLPLYDVRCSGGA
jgi:hypothetical protein